MHLVVYIGSPNGMRHARRVWMASIPCAERGADFEANRAADLGAPVSWTIRDAVDSWRSDRRRRHLSGWREAYTDVSSPSLCLVLLAVRPSPRLPLTLSLPSLSASPSMLGLKLGQEVHRRSC